jgi:hypothetical protein
MERSSQVAATFIRELSELADRLAARDIVVGSLHAEYSHFGCWQLIAKKHQEAVRFFWDGRDGYITVEGSPIREDHSAPNEWKQETVKGFNNASGDNPLRFVEDYLGKRFPV